MDGPFAKKKGPGARNRHLGELDGKLTPSRDVVPARPGTSPGGGGQALGQTPAVATRSSVP